MENVYWKKSVSTLISGIWLYTLAGIAASITGVVNAYLNPSGMMGMIKDMMDGESPMPISMGDIVEKMFTILVLVGYYLFFRSLTRFMRLQSNTSDCADIARVRTGYILMVVALFVDFIPLIGGLASFILIIVSYAKMLSGYSGLKRSATFPPRAREGASTLFSCTIWILVGCVLSFIPLIGSIIEGIILLVTFFMILDGWERIKNSAPNMTPEEEAVFVREEPPLYKQVLGDGLIAIFLLHVLSEVLVCTLYGNSNSPFSYTFDDRDSHFYVFLRILWSNWTTIVFVAIYTWLLLCSSKMQLNKMGRGGLVLLIVGDIISICADYYYMLAGLYFDMSNLQGEILDLAPPCLAIIGMILFVWGSHASRAIKITASLYPLIILIYWRLGTDYLHGEYLGHEVYQLVYYLESLLLTVIFFLLICIFVYKWRKKTITVTTLLEDSASSDDCDNTLRDS